MNVKWHRIPAVAALTVGLTVALVTAAMADDALPEAKTVIARYVEALGGADVIGKRTSVAIEGTFEMPSAGVSGEFSQVKSSANVYRMEIEVTGLGAFGEGYTDGLAWSVDPMQGPRILEGDRAGSVALRAVFPSEVKYDEMYESMEVVAVVDFDGHKCYRVALDPGWGTPRYEFFDVETGLLAGAESEEPGPDGGTMKITTVFHDYAEHGGQLVPMLTEQDTMMGKQVITIKSVEFDAVAPEALEPPDAVKILSRNKG